MSRRSGSLEFGTATSYEAGPELPSPDPSPPHAFTKNESPQHRHADDCGDSSAGGIRSVVSAPRRAWPDRLPFPLSYGLDSGAPVRRAISCVQRPHNHLGRCRTTAELPSDGVPPKTVTFE